MYFFLSKLLLFLLYPLFWILALLLFALIAKDKRRQRRLLIAAVILLMLFSNTFLFDCFATRWDVGINNLKSSRSYSCAIVLGGFSGYHDNDNGYFNESADRFIQGVKLYATGKVSHLLITGGNGSLKPDVFKEADWVKTQLEALKIPDTAILTEDASKNTIENARFSKRVLQNTRLKGPYLLVTSAFHMRRSLMIFKKLGFDVEPYPCNFLDKIDDFSFDDYFIPHAENMGYWNLYLKEVVGYCVNYFNAK